jgi:pimeloyl-ACP methyl ester carboxylesterase
MPKDIVAGHPTFWQTFGAGDRKGLAIHCSLARSGAWADAAARMEEPLALTAFDLPGHGQSADWDGTGDYIGLCARIADGFIDEPVDLIGHSAGAVAALQVALARPEMIRSLTLIEPVLFAAARGHPEWDAFVADMAPYRAALARGDRAAAAEAFTAVWGSGADWAEMPAGQRAYITDRIHLIEAGTPGLAGDSGGVLAEGGLECLDLPAMLIVGSDSPPITHRIAEEIAARLPDVGLAEVPGARHMLPLTHAAQVAGLIDVNLARD